MTFTIHDAAASRIHEICKNHEHEKDGQRFSNEADLKSHVQSPPPDATPSSSKTLRLRIAVQSGGCFGFQYTFVMDDALLADDHVFEHKGAFVVLDDVSLSFLEGCALDYQDDLAASMFVIKNPKAKGGCGCGNSFSLS